MINFCIFCYKTKCQTPVNWPLNMVICPKHLRCPFGLEIHYHKHETKTAQKIVGPFLRLAENVFFPKNTVVFPSRDFVDKTFRPDLKEPQMDDYRYQMNPEIVKYFHALNALSTGGGESDKASARYCYEVIRNLGTPYSEVELTHDKESERFINFYSELQQNLTKVEQKITNLPVSKHFKNVNVSILKEDFLDKMDDLSETYKLFMLHVMMNRHRVPVAEHMFEIPRCPFNMVYVKGIGLVTTEDVGHPFSLVLQGEETGSQIWYMSKTSTIPKNMVTRNVGAHDIQGFSAVHALQGASDSCLF